MLLHFKGKLINTSYSSPIFLFFFFSLSVFLFSFFLPSLFWIVRYCCGERMGLEYHCPFLVKSSHTRDFCVPLAGHLFVISHHEVFPCMDHRPYFKGHTLLNWYWFIFKAASVVMDPQSVLQVLFGATNLLGGRSFSWWGERHLLGSSCWFDDLASSKVVYLVGSLKLVYLGKGYRREIESLLSMTLFWNRAREIRRVPVAR